MQPMNVQGSTCIFFFFFFFLLVKYDFLGIVLPDFKVWDRAPSF